MRVVEIGVAVFLGAVEVASEEQNGRTNERGSVAAPRTRGYAFNLRESPEPLPLYKVSRVCTYPRVLHQ